MNRYRAGDLVEFFGVTYRLLRPSGPHGWYAADGNGTERMILTEYFKTVWKANP